MLCTSAALTPAAASLNALKIYPSCCMCVCVSLCLVVSGHIEYRSLTMYLNTHTITHSHTLLITCTCCYDLTKGIQDKDFSYSFFDSLYVCVCLCVYLSVVHSVIEWPPFCCQELQLQKQHPTGLLTKTDFVEFFSRLVPDSRCLKR